MNINDMKYSNTFSERIDTMEETVLYVRNLVEFGTGEVDEQKLKEEYDAKIQAKLKSGKRLSQKELQYLKRYNPIMYAHVMRIEAKRHSVEEQLKHAKSKQEVGEIQLRAVSSISKEDPVKQYMIAAVEETVKEFKKTDAYKRLPEVEEKEKKEHINKLRNKACTEEENITYEFGDGSYQLAYAENTFGTDTGFMAIS